MNLSVKQITFKSVVTDAPLTGWLYLPGVPLRAVVQICHGMQEHMGRYHDFMRFLARSGYAACGIDQLGHGRSMEDGLPGFFAEQDGWRLLVDNQYKFYRVIQKELPDVPVILLGHSMGSFIARLYAAKYPQNMNGLILSGTARSSTAVEAALAIARRTAKRKGDAYVSDDLGKLVFNMFNRPFRKEHPRYGWLSRDSRQVARFAEDPLCDFTFTAGGFRDLFTLLHNANEQKVFAGAEKSLPLLVFSGAEDPVGERGKGARQVYEQYVKAGLDDAQLILYDGGRHEMLNEVNREQVYKDVRQWLDEHFSEIPEEEPGYFEMETDT